jgi:hypothetical protein
MDPDVFQRSGLEGLLLDLLNFDWMGGLVPLLQVGRIVID